MGTVDFRRLLCAEDKAPNDLHLLMELPKSTRSVFMLQLKGNSILNVKCVSGGVGSVMNTQTSLILITSLLATGKDLSRTEEVHRKAINNLWAALACPAPAGHH